MSAVSTPGKPDVPLASKTSKLAAWTLGSKFSLAALANDRGIVPESVPQWFEEARAAAQSLNVPLDDLPPRPTDASTDAPSREVLGYILNQEKAIGDRLSTDFGDDHAAIFRIAIRSNLLRVLSTPGSKPVETLATSLAELGPRSGLPKELWQPLLDRTAADSTPAAIRAAVPQMHASVEAYLTAEQSSE
jgi:hypothetical protein